MLQMGRKYKNSSRKKYQSCINTGAVKKHITGIACINVANYNFEIKQEVVEALKSNAQYKGNEMCGVLTGSQITDNCFRISKISPPCIMQHSHCGCKRDALMANKFIEEDYEKSEHTRFYIGEWHTHPEKQPKPSFVDYSSIEENYHTALLVVPFLFMIIVGTQTFHISVYDGNKFVEIEPKVV